MRADNDEFVEILDFKFDDWKYHLNFSILEIFKNMQIYLL